MEQIVAVNNSLDARTFAAGFEQLDRVSASQKTSPLLRTLGLCALSHSGLPRKHITRPRPRRWPNTKAAQCEQGKDSLAIVAAIRLGLHRHSRLDACCRNISPVSNDGMGSAEQHWALCRSCQCHSRMHSASARSRRGRTDAVTKKNPKRIDARGVASMCKLETEQQGRGRGMGCRPVSACCKYNSQTQIAFHQPQRALRGLSVAVSGDMNWHTEVPP
jgi:hypothetical protein